MKNFMRIVAVSLVLCACGDSSEREADSEESSSLLETSIHDISWSSPSTGVINNIYKFHLWGYTDPLLSKVTCANSTNIASIGIKQLQKKSAKDFEVKYSHKNDEGINEVILHVSGEDISGMGIANGSLKEKHDRSLNANEYWCGEEIDVFEGNPIIGNTCLRDLYALELNKITEDKVQKICSIFQDRFQKTCFNSQLELVGLNDCIDKTVFYAEH